MASIIAFGCALGHFGARAGPLRFSTPDELAWPLAAVALFTLSFMFGDVMGAGRARLDNDRQHLDDYYKTCLAKRDERALLGQRALT